MHYLCRKPGKGKGKLSPQKKALRAKYQASGSFVADRLKKSTIFQPPDPIPANQVAATASILTESLRHGSIFYV
jgi:hypothetical protein